jgi:hypothetical protein
MKIKLIAVTLIILGVLAFLFSWDKFVDVYNFIGHPPESRLETYFVIVGQGLFYFLLTIVAVLFGFLLMLRIKGRRLKIVSITFFTLLTIWFILEVPIYKCVFYEINHSFWESKRGHFH